METPRSTQELLDMLKMLEGLSSSADELIQVGKLVIDKTKPQLVKGIRLLVDEFDRILSELEPELQKIYKHVARHRRHTLDGYMEAGFTRKEAFALVLESVRSSGSGPYIIPVLPPPAPILFPQTQVPSKD